MCICGIERQKEGVCLLSTSVQRSVRDDVFHRARFMTVTQAGLCRGVAWPRTRGHQQEDDLQETSQEKKEEKLTLALVESLIIIPGMSTTDNYSVNLAGCLAISYCERVACVAKLVSCL